MSMRPQSFLDVHFSITQKEKVQHTQHILLLQPCPNVSDSLPFLLFGDLHLSAALDLSMFVGGDTSVDTGVGLGHLSDLHLGILALVLDGDTTTGGDLPPFALHPLHTGYWVTSDLGDEGCGCLCEENQRHESPCRIISVVGISRSPTEFKFSLN